MWDKASVLNETITLNFKYWCATHRQRFLSYRLSDTVMFTWLICGSAILFTDFNTRELVKCQYTALLMYNSPVLAALIETRSEFESWYWRMGEECLSVFLRWKEERACHNEFEGGLSPLPAASHIALQHSGRSLPREPLPERSVVSSWLVAVWQFIPHWKIIVFCIYLHFYYFI